MPNHCRTCTVQLYLPSVTNIHSTSTCTVSVPAESQNSPCFWANVCKMVHPILSDYPVCLSSPVLSVNVGVLWPNRWMTQDETWHTGRPRPRPHCFRWGLSSPMVRGTAAPTFEIYGRRLCIHIIRGPCLLWPNGWMDQESGYHLVRR